VVCDDEICTSHEVKAKLIDDFYGNLIGTAWNREHSINLQALGIPSHDLADLEMSFYEKDVWEAIKQSSCHQIRPRDQMASQEFSTRLVGQ
jgi:hypothetical protein